MKRNLKKTKVSLHKVESLRIIAFSMSQSKYKPVETRMCHFLKHKALDGHDLMIQNLHHVLSFSNV